jgi:Amt family ammonium transporter
MPGHDMAFVTLGTFMLWFGWFGFNNGSVYMYVSGNSLPGADATMANIASAEVVQRTSMNTALGGASGGLTALLVAAIFSGEQDDICDSYVLRVVLPEVEMNVRAAATAVQQWYATMAA